jgi:hypothetical protein
MKTTLRQNRIITILAGAAFVLALQIPIVAQIGGILVWDNFPPGDNQFGNTGGDDTPVYSIVNDNYDAGSMYLANQVNLGDNIMNVYDKDGSPIPRPVDLSHYISLNFDILWDTTSGLTIDQWNTGTNWQASLFTTPEPQNYMQAGGWIGGIDIAVSGPGNSTDLGSVNIPLSAAAGWQTVSIPLNSGNIGSATDETTLYFRKFTAAASTASAAATGNFWIDNIVFKGTPLNIPVVVDPPAKAIPGLNVINATQDNSYYDRNEVGAVATGGFSWVGHTPCSYSYTIAGFPPSTQSYAYLFIVPNAAAEDNAPDYQEPTALVVDTLRVGNGSATAVTFRVNQPFTENYTNLVVANSAALLGTYTLTFTSDDGGYITVPDGTSQTFAFPVAGTGAAHFAENGSEPYNCLLYLGGQANDAAGIDQAVVYSSFSCTGMPSAFTENFAGESALVNVQSGMTHDPASIVLVKPTDAWWLSWSTPATGYTLEDSSRPYRHWNTNFTYAPIPAVGSNLQLVATADLQTPADQQYFRAADIIAPEAYAGLEVVLPGQTFVSGREISGEATPLASGPPFAETATVYAIDFNYDLMTNVNGNFIQITSPTDTTLGDFHPPVNVAMVNGVATFTGGNGFSWGNNGGFFFDTTEQVRAQDQATGFTDTDDVLLESEIVPLVH